MGRGHVFYGWRIVGVGALAQAISIGTTFYAYGALLKPVAAEFEASRLVVTLGLTLLSLVQGFVAPLLGRAIDAGWARGVLIGGVVMQACGMLLLARATAFWQVGLLFATAVAVGSTCFGPLATASVVANWFMRHRGRALGLTALGASLGGGVFPPLVTWLIGELGWRGAVAAMGVGVLVLIAPFAWLIVGRPEEIGSAPDGEPLVEGAAASAAGDLAASPSTAELVRTRNFWAISMAIGLSFCPVSVLLVHLVPYVTDLGHSPARAAFVMSVYAFSSGIGRVLFGSLADRIDKRVAAWISFGCLTLAWRAHGRGLRARFLRSRDGTDESPDAALQYARSPGCGLPLRSDGQLSARLHALPRLLRARCLLDRVASAAGVGAGDGGTARLRSRWAGGGGFDASPGRGTKGIPCSS
jgi:predicted MFS family arabinose efflux permease